jgi:hypothetical protein
MRGAGHACPALPLMRCFKLSRLVLATPTQRHIWHVSDLMTSTMVDTSSDPIPEELRQAFNEAVMQYSYWDSVGPEPEVMLHRAPWTISAVCSLVTKFDDPMPDNIFQFLCGQADSSSKLLEGDRSFRSGARCLAGLIQARKAQYETNRKR